MQYCVCVKACFTAWFKMVMNAENNLDSVKSSKKCFEILQCFINVTYNKSAQFQKWTV